MSSRVKIEKWLLADWGHGRNDQSMSKKTDDHLKLDRKTDEKAPAEGNRSTVSAKETVSATENNLPEEEKDFSESASSWEPSDGSCSSEESDAEETVSKTLKMEQYIQQYVKRRKGKRTPLPMHRPNAVVKVLQECKINENNRSSNDTRKRKFQETIKSNKSLPDSTRKNLLPPNDIVGETISISRKDILEIKATFEELFKMLNNMKPEALRRNFTEELDQFNQRRENEIERQENTEVGEVTDHEERSDRSQSEESNRSDDNVLITNKYHKAAVSPKNQKNKISNEVDEWIPIGSGKTLIHRDKYRKVNWKSYTIATRTLLLATFPRRILATHSLTGKRSPAFLNKPAKMCLDPKIVSDIIIEITSKFKVKENLVRGIITTKCADECKMLKLRLKNKNAPLTGFNVPQHNLKDESKDKENINHDG